MKLFRLIVPSLAGLLLASGTLAALASSSPAPAGSAAASPPAPNASETSLLPGSDAENLHTDASGKLWITEIESNTVRQLDPGTHVYTLYTGLAGGPHDAQLGPDGKLWWLEGFPQAVARMDLSSRQVITWPVDTHYAVALTFDASGRVWFVDGLLAGVYRFDPHGNQFCDFTLPGPAGGPFIAQRDGALWLSDYVSGTIGRLTATTNAYTYWTVNVGTGNPLPFGATFGPNGEVWWADSSLAKIGRLDPAANRVTLFGPPGLYSPRQVLYQGGKVWFTDPFTSAVGYIDPATAVGAGPYVVTPTTTLLTPDCENAGSGFTYTAGISTGLAGFSPLVFTTTVEAEGTEFLAPAGAQPWGLTAAGYDLWVTDTGRDKLLHLETALKLYLPIARR